VALTRRPLRSLLIGDVDHYPSEFAFGVNQALTRAGHWHTALSIRHDLGTIAKRASEVQPDVIWGHMLLWPPRGPWATAPDLLELCLAWRGRGAKVLIHDGDARLDTRFPADISPAVDLALCNHTADRSVWKIPQLHWPYFAFDQARMADPTSEFACDLAFAGRLATEGIYADRTRLVLELKAKLGERMKLFPSPSIQHTLYRTPELAVSARAILGYGRPDRNGWTDVRVYQYPGAGGNLVIDDGGLLEPWEHYWPCKAGSAESVIESVYAIDNAASVEAFRYKAFRHVQAHHSATARVRQALAAVGLTL
jgi:hypothetical protein